MIKPICSNLLDLDNIYIYIQTKQSKDFMHKTGHKHQSNNENLTFGTLCVIQIQAFTSPKLNTSCTSFTDDLKMILFMCPNCSNYNNPYTLPQIVTFIG